MRNRGYRYAEQVGPQAAGMTVLDYLTAHYRHSTRLVWQERIAAGEVELDGRRAEEAQPLAAGAELAWQRPPWDEPDVPLDFAVLARDEHVLAVAKPAGLPTAPAGGFLEHTLLARVRALDPQATPLHRLGRGTSGIVLFARTERARRELARAWREGHVRRWYRGRVAGRLETDGRVLSTPIGTVAHPVLGSLYAASPEGRSARTEITTVRASDTESILDIEIATGRPHQIRIHLAAAGHPLLGDPLYGLGGVPLPGVTSLPGEIGYTLHAYRIDHPDLDDVSSVRGVDCGLPAGLR